MLTKDQIDEYSFKSSEQDEETIEGEDASEDSKYLDLENANDIDYDLKNYTVL